MFDDAAYETRPGSVISPTDITEKVAEDLERIGQVRFHNPIVHSPAARLVDLKVKKQGRANFKLPRFDVSRLLLPAALVSIAVGLCLIVAGWNNNAVVKQQAAKLTSQASASSNPGSAPSSTPIAASAISAYKVAPTLPRYIDIPKLNVHARVMSLSITKQGALAAPGNIFDAGWYNQSAKPGQNGAMLVDGHISNWQAKGVFYGLDKLTPGDTIKITRGDGQVFSYNVVKTQTVNSDQVNMASLLTSQDTSRPGLNIISCSGDVIPGTSEFNKRIIIYALQT